MYSKLCTEQYFSKGYKSKIEIKILLNSRSYLGKSKLHNKRKNTHLRDKHFTRSLWPKCSLGTSGILSRSIGSSYKLTNNTKLNLRITFQHFMIFKEFILLILLVFTTKHWKKNLLIYKQKLLDHKYVQFTEASH